MTKTFRDLGVDGALCDALTDQGITHPFPIQELTLPLALGGNDLIGQARTGTGKTLAFGLPLLQRLDPAKPATQALVVVPTRELCLQVFDDLKIGSALGLTSIAVYGGVGFDEQIDALRAGTHVVVGTPGRLLDHLNRRNLDLSQVTQLVLDEADEMLDMGFLPDVERLVEACTGQDRHTMLFSATMPTAIVKLARRYMDHPTFTRADTEAHETAPNVSQYFLQVHRMDKPRVLARILQTPDRGGVYVFVRTKHMADRLVNELEDLGVPSVPVHGDLRQSSREKNLERFRSGKATVLVATEVAARGLDVGGVTHVVNYDCPEDEKMYLHRIGRTARAGEAGVAITFAEFNEVDKLNVIRKKVGASNTQVEQVFSTSDVLTELFGLPDERPWDHLSRTTGGGRAAPASERRAPDRRQGRTDGRPKSGRRSEGAGGGHDATRDRTPRSSGRTSDSATERADAGRGRATTQARPDRDGPARTAEDRSRTRTRTRSRGGARPDAGTDQGGSTQRSETRDAKGSGDGNNGSAPRKRARASRSSSAGSSGSRSSRSDASDRKDAGGDGKQRDGRGSADRSSRAERSGSQAGRGGRGARRNSGSSGRGSSEQRQREPIELERRGRAARGEGQPQPSRRVKVEHLP